MTCPDNDGDLHTNQDCGGDDCDDENDVVYGGFRGEFCGDGFDNDCDGLIDCADPVCQREDTCPTPTPSPTPRRPPPPDEEGGCDWCFPPQLCRATGCASPILIDTLGDGLALTDAETGVDFDLAARGQRLRISWTRAGSDDAWLALDRDGNGRVDNGAELFGNFSPQPAPQPGGELNGFAALAEFDKGANGGNSDGVIDAGDAVFARLRLWRDANHDGDSQPGELYALPALDVVRLHLDYKESKRADEYGNEFRFRAKLDDAKRAKAGRWAWDVFLVTTP